MKQLEASSAGTRDRRTVLRILSRAHEGANCVSYGIFQQNKCFRQYAGIPSVGVHVHVEYSLQVSIVSVVLTYCYCILYLGTKYKSWLPWCLVFGWPRKESTPPQTASRAAEEAGTLWKGAVDAGDDSKGPANNNNTVEEAIESG